MKIVVPSAIAALALSCTTEFSAGDAGQDTLDVQAEDTHAADVGPDVESDTGLDTPEDIHVDPGIDTHVDSGVDTYVDPGVDTHVDPGVDTYVDPGIDTYVDPGIDTHVDPGIDTYVDPGIDTYVDPGTDTVLDTWVDAETCYPGGAVSGERLAFEEDYMNIDVPSVERGVWMWPTDPGWDFHIAYNSGGTVHSRVFQNGGNGVEIAHLLGRTFSTVTDCDIAGATFTTGIVDEPFDTTRVILVRTDIGWVFKLGNPMETSSALSFDYSRLR